MINGRWFVHGGNYTLLWQYILLLKIAIAITIGKKTTELKVLEIR